MEPAGQQDDGQEHPAVAPGRLARVVPGWARRRPKITAGAAVVVVGALIAGVLLATASSSPPGPRYASLPGQSCGLVRPADLAGYLPGATGVPQTGAPGAVPATVKSAVCKWSSRSGDVDRTLTTQVVVFRSRTALADARLSYRTTLADAGCRCARVAVSKRPVAGLGDQAEELFVAPQPDANFVDAPNTSDAGASLLVLSSNALVVLSLNATAAATGAFLAAPPDKAQRDGLTATARGILDGLARPSSVRAPAVTAEAHYAGRRDPCRLISAPTLARYAPDAILQPVPDDDPAGLPQRGNCNWNAAGTSISLNLLVAPDVAGARTAFDAAFGTIGVTVTGARLIPDLGEAAVAAYTLEAGSDHVDLDVWSGNAELEYSYTVTGSGPPRLDPSSPLTGVIAMARDGLAALASPAASGYPTEPRYASSQHACTLVSPATLARYGITGAGQSNNGVTDEGLCDWGSDSESVFLSAAVDTDPDTAQGDYQSEVQAARENQAGFRFTGSRPVSGVGQQAEAVFQTLNGEPTVSLYVWSGNARLDVSTTDLGFGPPLSQAGKLAADVAMARDVLARLRRA